MVRITDHQDMISGVYLGLKTKNRTNVIVMLFSVTISLN